MTRKKKTGDTKKDKNLQKATLVYDSDAFSFMEVAERAIAIFDSLEHRLNTDVSLTITFSDKTLDEGVITQVGTSLAFFRIGNSKRNKILVDSSYTTRKT